MAELNLRHIEENAWQYDREAMAAFKSDKIIVRKARNVPIHQLQDLVADLKLRTSASNPAGVSKAFIDDPKVGGETRSGRWRNVRVEGLAEGVEARTGTIRQTLAYGLIQTYAELVHATYEIVGTRDRLMRPFAALNTAEKTIVEYRYKGVDPNFSATIKDQITLSTSNRVEVAVKDMEDGSHNIHVTTEANTWVTATNASATEDTWIYDYTASQTSPTKGLVRDWNNITKASVDTILGSPVAAWAAGAFVVGQACLSSNIIYICHTAHTAVGAIDTSKFDAYAAVKLEGTDFQDGSGKVRLSLQRMYVVAGASTLPDPKSSRQKVYPRPWSYTLTRTGYMERCVAVYESLQAASIMTVLAITDADLRTDIGNVVGYSVVDRVFKIMDDGTGTFTVTLESPTWTSTGTWASHFFVHGADNTEGYARNRILTATGETLAQAQGEFNTMVAQAASLWVTGTVYNVGDVTYQNAAPTVGYICTTYHTAGTWATDLSAGKWVLGHYVVGRKSWREIGDGEFSVEGEMLPVYDGTAEADAVTIRLKPQANGESGLWIREWVRRSATALTTLTTAGSGWAVKNSTVSSGYNHSEHLVDDHGDGAYTVRQVLVDQTGLSGTTVKTYWERTGSNAVPEVHVATRSSDDKMKKFIYYRHTAMTYKDEMAWDWMAEVDGAEGVQRYHPGNTGLTPEETNGNTIIVKGSRRVRKLADFYYEATCLTLDPTTNIIDWT